MDTEDFMSKLAEAGESLAAAFDEVGSALGKALDDITDIYDDDEEPADTSGKDDGEEASPDGGSEEDIKAAASDGGGTDDGKDVNDAGDTNDASDANDTGDGDDWGNMSDNLSDLIDRLDDALDGAQDAIDNLLSHDAGKTKDADDGRDDADKEATHDEKETVNNDTSADEEESSDEPPSAECLVADTVSGAADVLSTAVTDSLSLIDKLVEQSLDIAQKAQEKEECTDAEKEALARGKESIIAVSKLMQTVVKGSVGALQGMVKSYADAVKSRETSDSR